jgi:hypothetical protein
MKIDFPEFATKDELYKFIVDNEQRILTQKKEQLKNSDGFAFVTFEVENKSFVNKANLIQKDEIEVKAVINTTNVIDSHLDLHMPGIWSKSLKENKNIMHLQEHEMKFDKIISDNEDLKAYVNTYNWKQLGYEFEGITQALMFQSKVKQERNAYMFEQYAKGRVKNHSVGMRYVKLLTCINSDDYPTQKENWDKYYPEAINKEVADIYGCFWVVLEAKIIEGSAVPLGSNQLTPTISVKADENHSDKTEAEKSLQTEQKKQFFINLI